TGESLDGHSGTGLADHRVQQLVRLVDVTLRIGGQSPAELVRDIRQRTLEVGRQLTGVVTGCPPGHTIPLDEHDVAASRTQDEESRGDACDPCANDDDIDRRVGTKRPRRLVWPELDEPRRPVWTI